MAKFFNYKTYKPGFFSIFKSYQHATMKYLWSIGEAGGSSGDAWKHVNDAIAPKTISRASIIFFLQDMVAVGVVGFTMGTGKGGHHRIYTPIISESDFGHFLSKLIIKNLMDGFPEGTKKAMWEVQRGR